MGDLYDEKRTEKSYHLTILLIHSLNRTQPDESVLIRVIRVEMPFYGFRGLL